jgi:hypothetical protein
VELEAERYRNQRRGFEKRGMLMLIAEPSGRARRCRQIRKVGR